MERSDLVRNIRETLSRAGFSVSDLCSIRLAGFDLVARRDNTLLFVKILTNIDALSEDVAKEIITLSSLLKGCPLLVGEKTGLGDLEDNVVYFRFGIRAITLNTLQDHLLEGIPIAAYAAQGGLYVTLDEKKIQVLRQQQGVSLGEFARFVRVSRKTAQLYEKGMNARIEIASRIEELFNSPVCLPMDLFDITQNDQKTEGKNLKKPDDSKNFEQEVFSLLKRLGYEIVRMERCPFEAVSKEKERVLLTCVHTYNKKLIQKAQLVSSISRITEKHAVLFTDTDTEKKNLEGTPIIRKKELKKIRGPEEIIDLIIERI
ncbi:MAG: transcriptional regulator [Euryarchaeota archaeon]|nr:transcriptional regulator [Euryarchaeota archaeon]